MVGFLCSTPYHILLCLFMAYHEYRNNQKVLVVFNRFASAQKLCEVIKEFHLFKNVLLINTHDFDGWKDWNRRFRTVSFYQSFKRLCKESSFRKFIFFAPDLLEVSYMIKLISRNSPDCRFAFAEDGIGSYFNPLIYTPTSKINQWLRIFDRKKYLDKIDELYLLNPKLLTYESNYRIKPIQSVPLTDLYFNRIVDAIWGKNLNNPVDIIFLQQPFMEDKNLKLAIKQDKFINLMENYSINKNIKIGIKLHPRTKKNTIPYNFNKISSDVMYEIQIKNISDKTCFIGINSGALLTPFLLWKKNNPIVFLYKMCGDSMLITNMDNLLSRFKIEFVKAGGRLFIPESEYEFEEIMNGISKRKI